MSNTSSAYGTVSIYTTKKGDSKAVEWFVDAMNRSYSGDCGMVLNTTLEEIKESDGYYRLDFNGAGPWTFQCTLENFNAWYLRTTGYVRNGARGLSHDLCAMNLRNLATQQATKRIEKIVFSYYDYEPGCEYLAKEKVTLYFKDGFVIKLEENDFEDIAFIAENILALEFEDEAYDCSPYSLKEIDRSNVDIDDACIFTMMQSKQFNELSIYLASNISQSVFFYFSDFWDQYGETIHEWMDNDCVLFEEIGENVCKINNTILLLDGKNQQYKKESRYTAKCVHDFFAIVGEAMKGEAKDDVLAFLNGIPKKPVYVWMFLEEIFLESL